MTNSSSNNAMHINVIRLLNSLPKIAPNILRLPRDWDVIRRRYGLLGGKVYTLQDIGDYYDISRERVRQIESKATNHIHDAIQCDATLPIEFGSPQDRKNELAQVQKAINLHGPVVTIEEINQVLEERYSAKLTQNDSGAVRLLLGIFDFRESPERIQGSSVALRPSWIKSGYSHISLLHQAARAIHAVLSELNTATPFFDLKIAVVKKLKQKVETNLIKDAIKICREIEQSQPDLFQIQFEYLHSLADKAHRILHENGQPLHLSEIGTEISHRLAVAGQHEKIPSRSIQQQLVSDARFHPIGRSGKWVLSEWEGFRKESILELIEEYFHIRKSPVTLKEVSDYVIAKRPDASRNSIKIYLSNGNQKETKFIRISKDEYALSEWGGVAYSPKTTHKTKVRKQPTLEQTIQREISDYLSSRPNQESLVTELAEHIMQCTKCRRPTFYAYLSKMKNIVKEDSEKGLRCRLTETKNNHPIQFPQIQAISDKTLRSNLDRAIRNLTIEHVDLGLFELGKIFESELKSYLQKARDKGVCKVTATDLSKLALMIDCLERNNIINDKHVLTFLRQDRNERAHGKIPSSSERERLLKQAPHSAGLFIDYIVFLNQKKLDLAA